MKKLLILTGRFGMGHYSASKSLARQIQLAFPQARIELVDIFEYTLPEYAPLLYKSFELLVNRGSTLYNIFYRLGAKMDAHTQPYIAGHFLRCLDRLLFAEQPDAIISTLPFCSQLVSAYREKTGCSIPLITCITDVSVHPEWISPHTDTYLVASMGVKDGLIARGVDPDSILVGGIPVQPEFLAPVAVTSQPVRRLLIMGGGLGMLPKDDRFYKRLDSLPNLRTTIITGGNQKLFHHLYGRFRNIEVVGYTDKVSAYMHDADLILTKPGGITLFEAIFSTLPMLVVTPFLQQEINNAEFIRRHGIGRIIPEGADYIEEIERLINDTSALAGIRRQMQTLASLCDTTAIRQVVSTLPSSQAAAPRYLLPQSRRQTRKKRGKAAPISA